MCIVGVTIQSVGVSLRACKSGTIRGLRGERAGRRVKALISGRLAPMQYVYRTWSSSGKH